MINRYKVFVTRGGSKLPLLIFHILLTQLSYHITVINV